MQRKYEVFYQGVIALETALNELVEDYNSKNSRSVALGSSARSEFDMEDSTKVKKISVDVSVDDRTQSDLNRVYFENALRATSEILPALKSIGDYKPPYGMGLIYWSLGNVNMLLHVWHCLGYLDNADLAYLPKIIDEPTYKLGCILLAFLQAAVEDNDFMKALPVPAIVSDKIPLLESRLDLYKPPEVQTEVPLPSASASAKHKKPIWNYVKSTLTRVTGLRQAPKDSSDLDTKLGQLKNKYIQLTEELGKEKSAFGKQTLYSEITETLSSEIPLSDSSNTTIDASHADFVAAQILKSKLQRRFLLDKFFGSTSATSNISEGYGLFNTYLKNRNEQYIISDYFDALIGKIAFIFLGYFWYETEHARRESYVSEIKRATETYNLAAGNDTKSRKKLETLVDRGLSKYTSFIGGSEIEFFKSRGNENVNSRSLRTVLMEFKEQLDSIEKLDPPPSARPAAVL